MKHTDKKDYRSQREKEYDLWTYCLPGIVSEPKALAPLKANPRQKCYLLIGKPFLLPAEHLNCCNFNEKTEIDQAWLPADTCYSRWQIKGKAY